MIRVLIVINRLKQGGAERLVLDLLHSPAYRNCEVRLITLFGEGNLDREAAGLGVEPIHLNLERSNAVKTWWRLVRAIAAYRPTVVHAHLPESCWFAMTAGYVNRVRMRIMHVHNSYEGFSKHAAFVDRTASLAATDIVACSRNVGDYCINGGYPAKKVKILRNGVDLGPYEGTARADEIRERFKFPSDMYIITTIGSLTRQKAHLNFIQAAKIILRKRKDVLFIIAGDGPLRPQLEAAIGKDSITQWVRVLGQVEEIPQLLAATDIFALSSDWEGLPITLLEAGAAGLPIVSTDVGGVGEVIEADVTGLLVPPGDARSLATAITQLLEDATLRTTLGKAARERVSSSFDISLLAKSLISMYSREATVANS